MTQGGASQAVQQLEEYLQVQLIDRSKRPFLLTAEGTAFHAGCVQILRQFESLTEEVRSIGREISGRAAAAAIYSVGLSYLPELKQRIQQHYPRADVSYQFGHPDEVYRLVEQGIVDFGLVSFPEASKTIAATAWRTERMVLVASVGHPLNDRVEVSKQDLKSESLVAFAPNLKIRHEIDRYLRHAGVTMQIAAELDNIDSVKHALEVNSAVAFLPEPTVREETREGSMTTLPCPWLDLQRPLGLIQRRNCPLGRTARGVIELILAHGDQPESMAGAACSSKGSLSTPSVAKPVAGAVNQPGETLEVRTGESEAEEIEVEYEQVRSA